MAVARVTAPRRAAGRPEATPARTFDVRVRGIASGGAGVADLPDGRVVFVPRTAAGDHATIRVEKEKSRWAIGSLVRLTEAGPDRAEPSCALYDRCGGCQLQHLPYAHQLAWKGRFVADALTRLGHLGQVEPPKVEPSPETIGYRSRATFTVRRLRGGRVVAGLHALGRPAHVVDVGSECVLPEPRVMHAWRALRAGWGGGARLLPVGGRLRLTLRVSDAVDLLVEGGEAGWSPEELLAAVPAIRHVLHRGGARAREPGGGDGLDDDRSLPGFAFEQVNRAAAEGLRAHVIELVGPAATGATLVEAYCGDAEVGRRLASSGWTVLGIEVDPRAAAAAAAGAPDGFTVRVGPAESLLGYALPTDVLLVNPPRSGLHADVSAAVLEAPPKRLVYVSCDPATLARDVDRLSGRYRLEHLHAFDLFPQTAHVEAVVGLRRTGEGP